MALELVFIRSKDNVRSRWTSEVLAGIKTHKELLPGLGKYLVYLAISVSSKSQT